MTTTESRVNKSGFPLATCGRCSGSGQHSFNEINGTRCFCCGGAGVVIAKKARKAWDAFVDADRLLRRPNYQHLQIGDVIQEKQGGKVMTIAEIAEFDDVRSFAKTESNPEGLYHFYKVTSTDGDVLIGDPHAVIARRGKVDPAPYLAMVKP